MPEEAKYYVGRVVKRGRVTSDSLIEAISDPVEVKQGEFLYTFTDITVDRNSQFAFAYLAKYTPSGEVEVVEPRKHIAQREAVRNLQVAKSPFVYIAEHSVVAYQHIWNRLQREQFETAFGKLVVEKHDRFFAECVVEPISDLKTFVRQVAEINIVTKLEATVHPPNPLFDPVWKSLRDYMSLRNVDEVHIREKTASDDGVMTDIQNMARRALSENSIPEAPKEAASVSDAAVLMAADGYGKARVEGVTDQRRVVVRTQESQIHFQFAKAPAPNDLYEKVKAVLLGAEKDRDLRHE